MKIYGAGMAGLLAGNILRRHKPVIYEKQSQLPNNHAALLRFRTNKVSSATHIPFRKVVVNKAIKYKNELFTSYNIGACNQYSLKITGNVTERSICNLDPVVRYIAPDNFIKQSSVSLNIKYNSSLDETTRDCISTIPMPELMDIVGWKEKPEFNYFPIWSYEFYLGNKFNVYQTIYYADEDLPLYRASITGSKLTLEFTKNVIQKEINFEKLFNDCLNDFGLSYGAQKTLGLNIKILENELKYQKFGKLLPIDEKLRKEFILAMSDKYGIYSLGRFATWRQILLDDIVNDVKIIENYITERDSYKRKLCN